MNLFSKTLFWSATITLGLINPLISIVLVVLYYLPKIIEDVSQPCNDEKIDSKMKSYSEDILKDMK